MFADEDFASLSQEIGLASLGASDEDIKRLATCYWHSVEFGLLKEKDEKSGDLKLKAYGAGLLSSFGELGYACSGVYNPTSNKPTLVPWNSATAAVTEYPICSYQPKYFVAESLSDVKQQIRVFCEELKRPFYARYNSLTGAIWIDRAVRLRNELKP